MKKSTLLLFLCLVVLATACKKDEKVQEVYSMGIYSFNSNHFQDLQVIENYLQSKGAILTGYMVEAENTSQANQKAIEVYDQKVNLIDITELAGLVEGRTSFKYSLVRATPEGSSEDQYIKEKEYRFND